MRIVVSPLFIKFFLPKNISGIALFPFIIAEKAELKNDRLFMNHEKIHLRQQAELFLLFFILFYFMEFLFHLLKYKNVLKAYHSVSFEREAYDNESNYNYLKTRKWLSFIKYW